jgi:hypothetical protein
VTEGNGGQTNGSDPHFVTVTCPLRAALGTNAVLAALGQAAARQDGRRRIAAAVTGQRDLLTGQGASAPLPGVLRFVSALARGGATAVVEPACPRCGRQRPLSGLVRQSPIAS